MLKLFPIFIGWKNFTSGSDSNLVSFISFLSISGLASRDGIAYFGDVSYEWFRKGDGVDNTRVCASCANL